MQRVSAPVRDTTSNIEVTQPEHGQPRVRMCVVWWRLSKSHGLHVPTRGWEFRALITEHVAVILERPDHGVYVSEAEHVGSGLKHGRQCERGWALA